MEILQGTRAFLLKFCLRIWEASLCRLHLACGSSFTTKSQMNTICCSSPRVPLEVPFRPLGHSVLALDFYQFLLPRNPQLDQGSRMLVFKLYAQYHMLFLFKLVITLFLVIFISSLLKCFISRSLLKLSPLSHLQNIRQADGSSIALVITPGEKHPCSQSR